jgi:undecaprenyl-diphosphatase
MVLLAHHPSDVVAGALIGVVGAMGVRYWFAARSLGFAIGRDGAVSALALGRLKRVARGASAS